MKSGIFNGATLLVREGGKVKARSCKGTDSAPHGKPILNVPSCVTEEDMKRKGKNALSPASR